MENLFFLLAGTFISRLSFAKKHRNQLIKDTGCSVHLPPYAGDFTRSVTPSGDKLYANDYADKGVTYGIICIKLKKPYSIEMASALLSNYMNKLKKPFRIHVATGVQLDREASIPNARCLVDYWQDASGKDWKVKGFTNGSVMSILYTKNIARATVQQVDQFMESFSLRN